jgi:GTP cyclohydrolase subunit MoaC
MSPQKRIRSATAIASGRIFMSREAFDAIASGAVPKGDVLAAARIAGIMAAKQTSSLIPLCHTLLLSSVQVDLQLLSDEGAVEAVCTVSSTGKTGVEMEALTGCGHLAVDYLRFLQGDRPFDARGGCPSPVQGWRKERAL